MRCGDERVVGVEYLESYAGMGEVAVTIDSLKARRTFEEAYDRARPGSVAKDGRQGPNLKLRFRVLSSYKKVFVCVLYVCVFVPPIFSFLSLSFSFSVSLSLSLSPFCCC